MFWATMGVVPFVGPIVALAAMGIDDVLAKRAAPRLVRQVRKIATLLGLLLLSVPNLFFLNVSFDLFGAEQSNEFYVRLHDSRSHISLAYFHLSAGGIWFLALGYLALRKKTTVLEHVLAGVCWSGGVVAVMLAGTPSYDLPAHARHYVMREMHGLEKTLMDFGETTERLPKDKAEFAALSASLEARKSAYARGRVRLRYKTLYVPNATGPHVPDPPGPAPAMIYCAVTPDLTMFWLTGTVLRHGLVDDRVILLREVVGGRL